MNPNLQLVHVARTQEFNRRQGERELSRVSKLIIYLFYNSFREWRHSLLGYAKILLGSIKFFSYNLKPIIQTSSTCSRSPCHFTKTASIIFSCSFTCKCEF